MLISCQKIHLPPSIVQFQHISNFKGAGIAKSVQRRITDGRLGFDSQEGQETFIPFTASRQTLGPSQPAYCRMVAGSSILVGKVTGIAKLTTPLNLMSRLGIVELYFHSPIRLHNVVL
jgi:hypothetical protein